MIFHNRASSKRAHDAVAVGSRLIRICLGHGHAVAHHCHCHRTVAVFKSGLQNTLKLSLVKDNVKLPPSTT
jgi:hypothetical protein